MKTATVCEFMIVAALLLPAAGFAAQAGSVPAPASSVVERQMHRTQAELQRQRVQSEQLRTHVSELEQRSTANRVQLEQRDRRIAELQRQLDAVSNKSRTSPAAAGSH